MPHAKSEITLYESLIADERFGKELRRRLTEGEELMGHLGAFWTDETRSSFVSYWMHELTTAQRAALLDAILQHIVTK